jgi:hypothetical protein
VTGIQRREIGCALNAANLPERAHHARRDVSQRVVCQFSKAEICNLFAPDESSVQDQAFGWCISISCTCCKLINLGLEGVVQENVGRLDVPVYDPRMACVYKERQLLAGLTTNKLATNKDGQVHRKMR